MERKADEKPRTPVSAATPIATERITKKELPARGAELACGDARSSGVGETSHLRYVPCGTLWIFFIGDDQAITQHDAAVCIPCKRSVMRYEDQRGAFNA